MTMSVEGSETITDQPGIELIQIAEIVWKFDKFEKSTDPSDTGFTDSIAI
jgi:hypothetical protein